jgi:hypothetical protein
LTLEVIDIEEKWKEGRKDGDLKKKREGKQKIYFLVVVSWIDILIGVAILPN